MHLMGQTWEYSLKTAPKGTALKTKEVQRASPIWPPGNLS